MPIAATLQMEHPALLQALSFYLLAHGDPISMAEMLWQMYLLKNTENAYPECFIKANFGQISLTEGHYDHVDALYHYKLNMHGDFTAAKIFDKESELCVTAQRRQAHPLLGRYSVSRPFSVPPKSRCFAPGRLGRSPQCDSVRG